MFQDRNHVDYSWPTMKISHLRLLVLQAIERQAIRTGPSSPVELLIVTSSLTRAKIDYLSLFGV